MVSGMERKPSTIVLCDFCAASLEEHYTLKKKAPVESGAIGKKAKCDYCGKKIYLGGLYEMTAKRRLTP